MKQFTIFFFLAIILTGCGQNDPDKPMLIESDSKVTSSPKIANQTGREAYEKYCAGCHEEGIDGAPKTGDRNAWNGRSQLWEAVLFEHARNGYKNMPAKGGEPTLDKATVTKAAEYMMALTYPELTQGQ